jgi:arylsulfatase A-like enzyme
MRGVWRLIVATALISMFGAALLVAAEKRPPNIVVFLVDDLGATDLGCFGSTFYETPNVDRLAAGGMRFTAAHSACPVCSPTRASILTGRYPQRTGITDYINPRGANQPGGWTRNTRLLPAKYSDHLALEERTIAEVLRDAGNATFFAGKWHLGGKGFSPTDQGFEINKGGTDAGAPRSYFSPYKNPLLADGPPGESLPLRLAEETCKFIAASKERPFFAYLSFYSVHIPLQATKEGIAKYEAKAASLPVGKAEFGREHESKWRMVQKHPTYAAMVEEMDRAVGMVLDQLDELKLTENTIVIFTSDNGGLSTGEGSPTTNLPLRAGKGWMYEGGIRVPTIVRWPGVAGPGSTCATPIISTDYYPTLVEATGKAPAAQNSLDGVSIVPLLRGQSIPERTLYWDYPHYGNQGGLPSSAIREGKWKLIEWREDGALELYDLDADPGETHNLAKTHAKIAARLQELLEQWRREVGAKSPTPNPKYQRAL